MKPLSVLVGAFKMTDRKMKGKSMRNGIIILLCLLVATSTLAHDRAKLTALEQRLTELEERVAKLESATAPIAAKVSAEQRVNEQRTKARARMRKDSAVYSREQLREVETLYQVANRKWRSQEGKDSLAQLIEKFDKANRTGCALLYLGQMSEGREKEAYLQKAIDGFSDCYYGNGVQVGAYARYHLAYYYKRDGQEKKAKNLFKAIRRDYPDAISHKGRFLADLIGD